MEKCSELLEKSIDCYRGMLDHAHSFEALLNDQAIDAVQLVLYTEKLQDLQEKIEATDRKFMESLSENKEFRPTDIRLEQYQKVIEELKNRNETLIPRLMSMMDITRDELVRLKKGMSGISAYHSGNKQATGTIIRHNY